MIINKEFILEDACVRLLLSEPFFAALSRRIDKTECKSIPTAGVRINKHSQNFELLYNPEFFEKLKNDNERQDVLKHEYYHLILEHVTGRQPAECNDQPGFAKLWNFATDLAINSFLEHIPKQCLKPGRDDFKDYPSNMNAEWYYAKLKKDPRIKFINVNISDAGDHSQWGGDKPNDPEQEAANDIAKEKLKDLLRKAVNDCASNNSWGTISQELRKDILDRLTSKVDWKKILRYFCKTSQRANKNNSIRKINKRYPYIHPGKKVLRQANIAISIDQSGSVGDDLLATFFTELNKLSEIATFTCIPFDHEVSEKDIFIWKKGERKKWERVLCGGTDFNAPTKYVNDHAIFDGHIVLTDMCAPKPISSKCQRIWMTNIENSERPYFDTNEIIVPITIDKRKEV